MSTRTIFVFCLFFLLSLFGGSCGLIPQAITNSDSANSEQGGGDYVTVDLPVPADNMRLCVQGAGGSYSHSGTSTVHDLDFDTSNVSDEELYAPVGGVVYVHTESASSGFGYHLNIDLGDGTYVVVAHLKQIFVSDGEEVAAGQLLGYEGCTGLCTGDHFHIGRHEGDASLKAEFGTSVEIHYHAADATAEEEFEDASGDSFVCGIKSEGDPVDGHWYYSGLPVATWHPNGTLVKIPASTSVYLIENGLARWIRTQEIFWSLGYDFADVTTISDEELACLGNGEEIATAGMVGAVYDEFGFLWLVVGASSDSDRYRQMVDSEAEEEVLASWGINAVATSESLGFEDWPERSGYAKFRDGSLLKEESRSDVYVVSDGVAVPVVDWNTYLLLGFFDREIITVPGGTIEGIQEQIGSCEAGIWCLTPEAVTSCGGGLDLTDAGDYGGTDSDDNENCTDQDSDGYCSEATGGNDCWDTNDSVFPGAEDVCGNGIDEDCSGADEACPPEESDTDGDGVFDAYDNCPYHDNTDQSDIDHDGLGDSCDTDMDGDGVINSDDCDMTDPEVTACDTGGEVEESDTDTDVDADSDTDTDADSDSDTDSDSDADTDTDTESVYGYLTVTWSTDFGYSSDFLVAEWETVSSSGLFGGWDDSASETDVATITFVFTVVDGYTARYNVTSTVGGHNDWSCESTSSSESGDSLTGTHTVTYLSPTGLSCSLTPTVYHKTSGVVDGCETTVVASCD